jgi:hypothetical protein
MQLVLPFDSTSRPLFDVSFGSWLSHGRLEGVSLLILSTRKDAAAAKDYVDTASVSKVFDRVNFASVILSDNTIVESGLWSAYFRAGPAESFWAPAGTLLLSPDILRRLTSAAAQRKTPVIGPVGTVHPAAFYRRGAVASLRPWAINMLRGVHPPLATELAQRLAPKYSGIPEIVFGPKQPEDIPAGAVVAIVGSTGAALGVLAPSERPRKVGRPPKVAAPEEPLTEAAPPRIVRRTPADQPAE